jgi:hypothetical protein
MTNNIFLYRNNIEGNVGIGKLPFTLYPILENIAEKYNAIIPNKNDTTFHTYYSHLNSSLKTNFDTIQYHHFWKDICLSPEKCIIQNVIEMNELYYSNPKPNFNKTNLYGAAANLIPHKDCILFNFDGIRFYRVIIGLTENNEDTITEFINFGIEHKINKGDYMIFDFDRTLHQVKKLWAKETPRILLKLHFIVCENCKYSAEYVTAVSYFYIAYYYVARYTEQIGTDPTTFIGFLFGLLWEYPFHSKFGYILLTGYLTNLLFLNKICKVQFNKKKCSQYCSIFSIKYDVDSFVYCIILLGEI